MWIIIILILLFALATFMGKSYVQTLFLLLLAGFIAFWPRIIKKKWGKKASLISRLAVIIGLVFINTIFFIPKPKTTIYTSEEARNELMAIYDQKMSDWPEGTEDIYLKTKFGKVHVLAYGSDTLEPIILIHAASMGAHSWAENLEPLLGHYRIYSVDNIGEGNKSELANASVFPNNPKEVADHLAEIANALGIEHCPVFGASNGGFVAISYAYHYPDRVEKLVLFGPMGLTQLTGNSIFMLSVATLYPFDCVRNYVAEWALGKDMYVNQKYGDWFSQIMKATIPSLAQPVPLTKEQKKQMDLPVLLFLGTRDMIVGDAAVAKETAKDYPDIIIEVLESGHIVSVEHADYVNKKVSEFLY